MKRLLLLISFSILCLFSFAQTNVQQDNRVNQILKSALASKIGYYIYGRTGASGFINIAVLNQSSHTLCWFTCHGRLFDSTKLTVREFEQVTSKQLDPFVLYQNICDKYLADIAAAKDIYRVYGDIQLFDKLNGSYRALFAMETVQAAKTPLQKLIAIENVRKKILTQLAYMNCASPFGLHDDPLYKINKDQAGAMIQTKDSTIYYNIDPTSAVAKISLYKKSAGQFYIQNRFSEIIDSVAIQPEKYDLLQKEKTDVFLLYRGWLEMQWMGTLSAIRRQSAGLYNQVDVQNEKSDEGLYSQLNAIAAKIDQLNSPEAKSIEQAVYEIYKNETSEINYIPLLGIGYSLTQTRGQKEYELTNHLGNVLVTVTDKKIGVSSPSNSSLIDHYEPDIVSAQDYYPFGMLQPGRSYLSPGGDKYRYGFNGKENDNEVKGEGNQQDYGMRVYDPRLGRFLSVDPITKDYPELTPYQYASNNPVQNIDLDGLEGLAGNMNNPGKYHIPGDANDDGVYSKQELKQGAAIAGLTTLVAVDAIFTKGALTRTFGNAMLTWGFLELVSTTNNNGNQHDPKIRAENEKKARQQAANLIIGFGTGYLFSKGLQATNMVYQEAKGVMRVNSVTVDPVSASNGVTSVNAKATTANGYQGMEVLDDAIRKGSTQYIPETPLKQQRVNDVDIPLPDPLAQGYPHTTLGGKLSNDGTFYRQSATFPGSNVAQVNGFEVPWGRVDWYHHGRPWDHFNSHIHTFYYDFNLKKWTFPTGGSVPFPFQLKLNYKTH